jgi:hypothetical protein
MKFAAFILVMAIAIALAGWKLCFPGNQSAGTPMLESHWDLQVYNLDDDEVIRLIAPPYPPQRATRWAPVGQFSGQVMHLVRSDGYVNAMRSTSRTGTVRSALALCVDLPQAELRVEPHAGSVVVDGDWIVREQAPDDRRMQGLTQIIGSATQGKIEVTANSIYAYCVVVQGSWNVTKKDGEERKPLRFDENAAQYALSSGAPQDFLRILEHHCRCRFIDETVDSPKVVQEFEPSWPISETFGDKTVDDKTFAAPKTITWVDNVPPGFWDAFKRRDIFRTLESQSSLRFTETRRPIPIWSVRERAGREKASNE